MNANREADQEHMQEMLARMDTNRNDNWEEMKAKITARKEEMKDD
jgi:hypothetical protein